MLARDRVVSIPHNDARTCGFSIPITADYQVARQVALLQSGFAFVRAYRGTSLEFHGPVVTAQRVGENQSRSLAVTCMDTYFHLLGMQRQELSTITTISSVTNPLGDSGLIAGTLIGARIPNPAANYKDHGIWVRDISDWTSGTNVAYTYASPSASLGAILSELSASSSGFDWRLDPIEYAVRTDYSGGSPRPTIARFRAASVIGSQRPDCSFEYGMGKRNLTRAEHVFSRERQATSVSHANASLAADPIRNRLATLTATEQNLLGFGREDIIESDLATATERDQLSNLHLALRARGQRTIAITPAVYDSSQPQRVPQYTRDWAVGDWVKARAADAGGLWFDGYTRIWGATFRPDANGVERVELQLVPNTPS